MQTLVSEPVCITAIRQFPNASVSNGGSSSPHTKASSALPWTVKKTKKVKIYQRICIPPYRLNLGDGDPGDPYKGENQMNFRKKNVKNSNLKNLFFYFFKALNISLYNRAGLKKLKKNKIFEFFFSKIHLILSFVSPATVSGSNTRFSSCVGR